jgi:hypothetical protein
LSVGSDALAGPGSLVTAAEPALSASALPKNKLHIGFSSNESP